MPEEAHAAYMAAKARLHIGGRGHYLELKHGPLPFRVVWGESDAD